MATKKQLAARRKFVAAVRAGKFRKRKSKKTTKTKVRTRTRVITKVKHIRTMARRRRSSTRSTRGLIPSKAKSLLKNAMIGLGAGATISTVGSIIGQPQLGNNKLISTAASFVVGGPIAAAVSFLMGGGFASGGNGSSEGMA